jgi:uncharacterized protein (DUF1015 family)
VTTIGPFAARVVKQDWAERVVCPMHDAIPASSRPQYLVDNPWSYLHVMRSEQDLPGATQIEIGQTNAAALRRLLEAGAYADEGPPSMYVYRVHRGPEEHVGIVAEVALPAFVDGQVLGHEAVHEARVEALTHHFAAVPARSELVALMHRHDPDIADVLRRTLAHQPELHLHDATGVEQAVWTMSAADVELVRDRLGAARHYVADGHHRVAASVRQWREAGEPAGSAVLSVLYPEDQMHLLAFHRRVAGPIDADRTLAAVRAVADVEELAGGVVPHGVRRQFDMYLNRRWYRVVPRAGADQSGAAGLDVTQLDRLVLTPLLGVTASDPRVEYVSELADLDAALARCDDDGGVLFRMVAPSLDQLVDVAERGEVMPPKSTYFEPKPRAGIFLRFD